MWGNKLVKNKYDDWLKTAFPKYTDLTKSIQATIISILNRKKIDFLDVAARTKTLEGIVEKIERKGYTDPQHQLTDVCGIRIIVFLEDDVKIVSKIIEDTFQIDVTNSSNKDSGLRSDQVGYRSVHYVCNVGEARKALPEFSDFAELKFEVQIRTVLQHAWAELSHDRNYKFSADLPPSIERRIFLHAGMLELADRGFQEISNEIDSYRKSIIKKSKSSDFDITIDSISLETFVKDWCLKNNIILGNSNRVLPTINIPGELRLFGIFKLKDLNAIIPEGYAEALREYGTTRNYIGIVRDWMVIKDFKKYYDEVKPTWKYPPNRLDLLRPFFAEEELEPMKKVLVKGN